VKDKRYKNNDKETLVHNCIFTSPYRPRLARNRSL